MKFTYDTPETDTRECVAYIDGDGGIVYKVKHTHVDDIKCVCIDPSGFFHFNLKFYPKDATHKFYSGDSITITF